jgi:hypothetical protein
MSDLAKYRSKDEWESTNPILASGQPGFEDDTGKLKIGDGTSRWSELSYRDVPPYTLPPVPFSFGPSDDDVKTTAVEAVAEADLAFTGLLDFSAATVTGLPGGVAGQPTTSATELTSGILAPERIADNSLPAAKIIGTFTDNQIPASIARDSEVATAVSSAITPLSEALGSKASQASVDALSVVVAAYAPGDTVTFEVDPDGYDVMVVN